MFEIFSHLINNYKASKSDSNSSKIATNIPEVADENPSKMKFTGDQIPSLKFTEKDETMCGKVVYAESADSDMNSLFEIKVSDDVTHIVHLPDMKWNAVLNDKVKLIGKQNSNGKIEFSDMQPKNQKDFEYGRVTAISGDYAVFESNIIMKFNAMKKFPLLKMYDEYKLQLTESDQKCDARIFDYRVISLIEKVEVKERRIEFKNDPIKIMIEDRRDVKVSNTRFVTILNKSSKAVDLINLKIIPQSPSADNLIKLDKDGIDINYNLNAMNGKFKVYFKVQPKVLGTFVFDLVAKFKDSEKTHRFSVEIVKSYILPGRQFKRSPRFVDVRIDEHSVPQEMRQIDFNKIYEAKDELIEMFPVINEDLTAENYQAKMELGIYLEEIALEKAFASYRIERAVFETKGEFLRLIVKDVAEKRPSIIIGDKIIATDPFRTDDERPKYEAFIFKVEHDSVLCKFHDDFHKTHNEKEFTIDFQFSRSNFKRQQHAVLKITSDKSLGTNFLFPSKTILCNEVQVNAALQDDELLKIDDHSEKWFNNELNKYQKSAIVNVLRGENRPLPYIIFGCPGSGKTRTAVEMILQIYTHVKTSKIIVATPSNSAANLITEMLINTNVLDGNNPPFLRIVSNNQVERDLIPECLRKYCGTVSIAADDGYKKIEIIRNKHGIWQNCTKTKIKEYRIIIGTLNCIGALMQMNLNSHFSHVIIDEAGQSVEPETVIPLTLLNPKKGQCVLAGDPKQLGPILVSRFGKMFNYNFSMLERLVTTHSYYEKIYGVENNDFDPNFVTKLKINYRSHPSVLKLYNDLFYNGELVAAVEEQNSPEALLLANQTENVLWQNTNRKCGIYFVNVENGKNKRIPESCSWFNDYEIKRIISFLNKCKSSAIPFHNIGIVTPYALQVKKLREQIFQNLNDTDLKIGTVEEFQGQERMIMIVTTVRTNKTHLTTDAKFGLGFIQCPKRMNVAISRARALLVVFGKEKILEIDDGWKKLIEYTKNNNTYVVETC